MFKNYIKLLCLIVLAYTYLFSNLALAEPSCSSLLITEDDNNSGLNIFSLDKANLGEKAMEKRVRQALKDNGQLVSPIELTDKMQAFRSKFLPKIKSSLEIRRFLIETMEAKIKMKASIDSAKIKQSKEEALAYDLIIVGAGVHGLIALNTALRERPDAKILLVDSRSTIGSTFREKGNTFFLNSTNRPSGQGLPLPGLGNLNELPLSPVQVSDLSPLNYPSSGDLSDSLLLAAYAQLLQASNVSVVFDLRVKTKNEQNLRDRPQVQKLRDEGYTEILGRSQFSRNEPALLAKKIVIASGLGSSTNTLASTSTNFRGQKYSFNEIMSLIATSNDPKSIFSNKRIAVVGDGDSAKVFIEFLLGYAPEGAYSSSSGETFGPSEILWYGQSQKSCDEFVNTNRNRYARIGPGFRTSLIGIESRFTPGTAQNDLDIIVFATGYENDLSADKTSSNNDQRVFLKSPTRVSGLRPVNVARALGNSGSTFFIGPAAGDLTTQSELSGVVQNSVSIFNNAPRTVAALTKILEEVESTPLNTTNLVDLIPTDSFSEGKKFKSMNNSNETKRDLAGNSEKFMSEVFLSAIAFLKDEGYQTPKEISFKVQFLDLRENEAAVEFEEDNKINLILLRLMKSASNSIFMELARLAGNANALKVEYDSESENPVKLTLTEKIELTADYYDRMRESEVQSINSF